MNGCFLSTEDEAGMAVRAWSLDQRMFAESRSRGQALTVCYKHKQPRPGPALEGSCFLADPALEVLPASRQTPLPTAGLPEVTWPEGPLGAATSSMPGSHAPETPREAPGGRLWPQPTTGRTVTPCRGHVPLRKHGWVLGEASFSWPPVHPTSC